MIKLIIGFAIVFFVLWLVSRSARNRRAAGADDRRRRKAHNSRHVRYAGFEVSADPKGRRKVHTTERAGKHACSDNCKYCAAGAEYQANLKVFDDRLIRGRRNRKKNINGQ